MSRLLGLETEYGILVEGKGPGELMEESRRLVAAYEGIRAGPWDYGREDPRRDLRGYRVDRLQRNPRDAVYDRHQRPLSMEEQRADRVLTNGARLYNDHGHPEYATPECASLRDLVAHDRAGERIAFACARARSVEDDSRPVVLFKNNTDFHGMSYGCHESYLLRRDVEWERLYATLLPFFVTRPLFAGAGKVGVETGGPFARECDYQLSQRADFFTEEASVDTLHRRPILNTRDEPHAPERDYRRLHVICGDANLSQWATALKVGTTSLVLSLVEAGWQPHFRIHRPVEAIRRLSRDPSLRWLVDLEGGRRVPATELQRRYCCEARGLLAGRDAETDWVLQEWEQVLEDLEREPMSAGDRVDWAAKRRLLESFVSAEGIGWDDPVLRSLDLEYHNLDPEAGLFAALEAGGQVRQLVDETAVVEALTAPPPDTRAWIRGECVRRFSPSVTGVGWSRIRVAVTSGETWIDLEHLVDGEVGAVKERCERASTLEEFVRAVQGARDDE